MWRPFASARALGQLERLQENLLQYQGFSLTGQFLQQRTRGSRILPVNQFREEFELFVQVLVAALGPLELAARCLRQGAGVDEHHVARRQAARPGVTYDARGARPGAR